MRASVIDQIQHLRLSRDGLAARRLVRSIGIATAVGVTYFLAAWLSFGLRIPPENVIYWPAAGVSSGVLISLWTIARWPVVVGMMVATIVVNLLQHFSVAATAAWVVGNTAEPLTVAGLIHHYFGENFKIDRLHRIVGLLAAAVIGTAVAATWWTAAYYWLFASLKEPTTAWLHWIISDLGGIVSVAPLVIGLAATLQRPPPRREIIEGIAALVVLGAMTVVIVSLPPELWETVVPAALVFPMLLWVAARCQPVFAAAGAFMVSMTVALTAIYGLGHFGDTGLSIGARVLQTQTIILVVAFGTAVLAALFAERRESEARLLHSNVLLKREQDNKLLTAQAVTAAIAHEVRQPLMAITVNAGAALHLFAQKQPDYYEIQEALNEIESEGHRASEVFDAIRALFGRGGQEEQPVDINDVIYDVIQSLQGQLKQQRVTVHRDLTDSIPPIQGHRGQLRAVIFNLVINAIEAMELTTDRERMLHVRTGLQDRDSILVSVRDSGPGIDPRELEGIFSAFATTKAQGTGLGLAICRMIVDHHGGKLSAASDGISGARFQFVLPIGPRK